MPFIVSGFTCKDIVVDSAFTMQSNHRPADFERGADDADGDADADAGASLDTAEDAVTAGGVGAGAGLVSGDEATLVHATSIRPR